MADVHTPKRSYDSSTRRAQAQLTRQRVLADARRLFIERGFFGTTMADVAGAAGVSTPTLYAYFSSKTNLLKRAIETAVVNDAADRPLADRPAMREVHQATTAAEVVRRFCAVVSDIARRTVDIYVVALTASESEPDIADMLTELERQRHVTATRVAQTAAERAGISDSDWIAEFADTIWALNSALQYQLLVQRCGWSPEHHRAWVTDILVAMLERRVP